MYEIDSFSCTLVNTGVSVGLVEGVFGPVQSLRDETCTLSNTYTLAI